MLDGDVFYVIFGCISVTIILGPAILALFYIWFGKKDNVKSKLVIISLICLAVGCIGCCIWLYEDSKYELSYVKETYSGEFVSPTELYIKTDEGFRLVTVNDLNAVLVPSTDGNTYVEKTIVNKHKTFFGLEKECVENGVSCSYKIMYGKDFII